MNIIITNNNKNSNYKKYILRAVCKQQHPSNPLTTPTPPKHPNSKQKQHTIKQQQTLQLQNDPPPQPIKKNKQTPNPNKNTNKTTPPLKKKKKKKRKEKTTHIQINFKQTFPLSRPIYYFSLSLRSFLSAYKNLRSHPFSLS